MIQLDKFPRQTERLKLIAPVNFREKSAFILESEGFDNLDCAEVFAFNLKWHHRILKSSSVTTPQYPVTVCKAL
jgi:hypothetical protein